MCCYLPVKLRDCVAIILRRTKKHFLTPVSSNAGDQRLIVGVWKVKAFLLNLADNRQLLALVGLNQVERTVAVWIRFRGSPDRNNSDHACFVVSGRSCWIVIHRLSRAKLPVDNLCGWKALFRCIRFLGVGCFGHSQVAVVIHLGGPVWSNEGSC